MSTFWNATSARLSLTSSASLGITCGAYGTQATCTATRVGCSPGSVIRSRREVRETTALVSRMLPDGTKRSGMFCLTADQRPQSPPEFLKRHRGSSDGHRSSRERQRRPVERYLSMRNLAASWRSPRIGCTTTSAGVHARHWCGVVNAIAACLSNCSWPPNAYACPTTAA